MAAVGLTAVEELDTNQNAIFNGDFQDGVSGWSRLGPGHADAEFEVRRHTVAHRAECEFFVKCKENKRRFTVYSAYPIGVKSDKTYSMTLRASGEGDLAFGAFEYAENKDLLAGKYSERVALTPELKTYTFEYAPSAKTAQIRPAIVFFESPTGSNTAVNARLINFKLPVPNSEFSTATTNWPKWKTEGVFKDYQGFGEEKIRQIKEAVTVNRVLNPYQPIRKDGKRDFLLTTSRFRFGNSVFPESISVLGKELLSDKMRFEVRIAGQPEKSQKRSAAIVSANDQQVVVEQKIEGEDWSMVLKGTLAYDGLMLFDVQLRPGRNTQITGASLTIPFTKETARYIRYNKDLPKDQYCFGYGPIPAGGETVAVQHAIGIEKVKNDWSPQVLSEAQGMLWKWDRGFLPFLWIGDEEKGLGWISESDQGWNCGEKDTTFALERTREGLTAVVHFITTPVTVKSSWELRFAFQVTPPKTVREDWFKMRFTRFWDEEKDNLLMLEKLQAMQNAPLPVLAADPPPSDRYAGVYDYTFNKIARPPWTSLKRRGLKDIGFLWWTLYSVGCGSPQVAKPELLRSYLRASPYMGHLSLPYFAPTHLSSADVNAHHYAVRTDEWAKLPRVSSPPYYVKICPNSFASEYQAYEIGKMIDQYGIEGVYFDNCHPEKCANRDHGCGYVDSQGVTQPSIPYFGMRRLFMMIRHEFVKRGKQPFIMTHAGYFPATMSFIDVNMDGEGTYGSDHTEMITPGEFRARFIGPNQFGTLFVYLPQFGYGVDRSKLSYEDHEKMGARRLMALTLVHGTAIYGTYIDRKPLFASWGVLDELTGPKVEFIPYWKWPLNNQLNPKGIYASVYRQPEQSVLAISNLTATDTMVEIPRAELNKLIPGLKSASDTMDQLPVTLNDKHLKLEVSQKNFRLILLK
jgi:hypothetical protein